MLAENNKAAATPDFTQRVAAHQHGSVAYSQGILGESLGSIPKNASLPGGPEEESKEELQPARLGEYLGPKARTIKQRQKQPGLIGKSPALSG